MRQAAFEGEKSGQNVKELALKHKRPEGERKADDDNRAQLDQVFNREIVQRIIWRGVGPDEAVAGKQVDEVGWRAVEEDVFEVEQNDEQRRAPETVTGYHRPDGCEENSEEESVVLEVNVIDQDQAAVRQHQERPVSNGLARGRSPVEKN